MKRRRGVADRNRMRRADIARHRRLEGLDRRALGYEIRFQRRDHRRDVLVADVLAAIGNHAIPSRNFRISATDRKCGLLPDSYSKSLAAGAPFSPIAFTA